MRAGNWLSEGSQKHAELSGDDPALLNWADWCLTTTGSGVSEPKDSNRGRGRVCGEGKNKNKALDTQETQDHNTQQSDGKLDLLE